MWAGGDASFFFIPDLTDKATGSVLIVLIVLYVGSQLASTLLMSTTTDRTQRMIFLALPFVFVIFIINFPAGLLVYWITTNLWTIVQQAIIRKRLGPMRPPGQEGMGLGELLRGGGSGVERPCRGRGRRRRRQPTEGPPERPAAGAAAPQEEALRTAPMSEAADRVEQLLDKVTEALALDADIVIEENEDGIRATLEGDELGLFIGRHGTTIDAVQHLAFKAANRDAERDAAVRVTVDAAGYRERREEMLHRQADQAASRPPAPAGRSRWTP